MTPFPFQPLGRLLPSSPPSICIVCDRVCIITVWARCLASDGAPRPLTRCDPQGVQAATEPQLKVSQPLPSAGRTRMGRVHRKFLPGTRIYACSNCHAHLSSNDDIVSKSFQGRTGRAYLFNTVAPPPNYPSTLASRHRPTLSRLAALSAQRARPLSHLVLSRCI